MDKFFDSHRLILWNTSIYLLVISILYALLLSLNIVGPLVRVELLALIIGLVLAVSWKSMPSGSTVPKWLLGAGGLLLLFTRSYSYFYSVVPPGYDPGWYKFVFEHPFSEVWTKFTFEGLFTWLFGALGTFIPGHWLVVGSTFVLSILVGYVVYYVVSKWLGSNAAVIAFLLYCASFAMYKVFWFTYIKNLFGMGLLLIALYLLTRSDLRVWTILVGGLIGGFHRPAFLLFGVVYLLMFFSWGRSSRRFIDGVAIVALALLFNVDRVFELIIPVALAPVTVEPGTASGTFFNLRTYWSFAFLYVPFAVLGLRTYFKKLLPLVIGFLICSVIVILELFFYNRYIIYFDFLLIILAAAGLSLLLTKYPWLVYSLILVTALMFVVQLPSEAPLISETEFSSIQSFSYSPLLVTDKYYSTWVKGYSSGIIVAPGLFDNNPWTLDTWAEFWANSSSRPLLLHAINVTYVHAGRYQPQYFTNDSCFILVEPNIYRLVC